MRVLALLSAIAPAAAAQTNSFVTGTVYETEISPEATRGENLAGMRVTWTFADNSSGSADWQLLAPELYGISQGGLLVGMARLQDVFNGTWLVSNNSGKALRSLRFNGRSARAVFDCGWTQTGCAPNGNPENLVGTGISSAGFTLSTATIDGTSVYGGGVLGEYANLVGRVGRAPVGDLFEQLTLTFTDDFSSGLNYGFRADVDNTTTDILVPPPPTVVPEPSTWALLAMGLAGLAALDRRRRRAVGA